MQAILRGPSTIDLAADASGTGHRFAEVAADTSNWAEGLYTASIRVTDGTDVFEVECGQVTIAPDLVNVLDGTNQSTHAQKVLAAIEAVLENRATKDQQSYTINNRSLQRTPIADLLKLRESYRKELAAQKPNSKHGKLLRRKITTRFV